MDVEDRVRMQVAIRAGLAMLAVVEGHEAGAGDHDQRVLVLPLRMLLDALGRVLEVRQRIEVDAGLLGEHLDDGALELDLARRGQELEAGLLVLLELLLAGHVPDVVVELLVREAHRGELEVQHVLGLGPPPLVLLAEADRQAVEELVVIAEVDVGAALEAVDDARLGAEVHRTMVHDRVAVVGALQPGRGREHVVGERAGRRHEVVMDDEQLEVHEGLDDELGVRERHDGVVGLDDERLDRIGIAVAHSAEQQRRVGVGVERRIRLGDDVPALERQTREAVVADHLVALLLRQSVVLVERRWEAGRRCQQVAALLVEVAGDGTQDRLGLDGAGGVDAARVAAFLAPRQAGRSCGRVHAGSLADLVGRDPGDLGDFLRRVLGGAFLQLVEADAPLIDELVVVEILLDDDVDHAECQGGVGAGADLQEQIGLLRDLAEARVDDHELGAALLHVGVDPVPQQRLRGDGVAAP